MVSAICPQCKILLVEANNAEKVNLLTAEEEAVKLKATISNSLGGPEEPSETEDDKDFNHGVPIAVAGDSGYGAQYPAASPDVISVGGTALVKSSGTRGWSEETWLGPGSGCSADRRPNPHGSRASRAALTVSTRSRRRTRADPRQARRGARAGSSRDRGLTPVMLALMLARTLGRGR